MYSVVSEEGSFAEVIICGDWDDHCLWFSDSVEAYCTSIMMSRLRSCVTDFSSKYDINKLLSSGSTFLAKHAGLTMDQLCRWENTCTISATALQIPSMTQIVWHLLNILGNMGVESKLKNFKAALKSKLKKAANWRKKPYPHPPNRHSNFICLQLFYVFSFL